MKKLYAFILAAAASLGASAQTFSFYIDNKQIEEGQTIFYNDMKTDETGDPDMPYQVTFAPNLFVECNMSCTDTEIKATCTTGQKIQMCIQPSCKVGTEVVHQKVRLNPYTKQSLDFHYQAMFTSLSLVPTDVTVNFSVKSAADPSTKKKFTLRLNSNESSVSLVEKDSKPIEVTAEGISYNINGNATVSLFNALGAMVASYNVSGNGVLPTDNLQRGLYIYTVRGAGANHSGKIYIK